MNTKNFRLCPFCNSPWVCWNWFQSSDWGHECWDCDHCHTTSDEVVDGIPYEDLKASYPEENALMGEIKACNESLIHFCEELVRNPQEKEHWERCIKDHVLYKKQYQEKLQALRTKSS